MSIAAYYDTLVEQYGHDYRAVDAGNPETPDKLRKVLSEVADLSHASVLEVGCAFGDLRRFLPKSCRYTGIDVSPKMIEVAKSWGRLDSERFLCRDLMDMDGEWDYVLAEGIFYKLDRDADIYPIVTKMQSLSRLGIGIVALQFGQASERCVTPDEIWSCLPLSHVVLRKDFGGNHFALYAYREPR